MKYLSIIIIALVTFVVIVNASFVVSISISNDHSNFRVARRILQDNLFLKVRADSRDIQFYQSPEERLVLEKMHNYCQYKKLSNTASSLHTFEYPEYFISLASVENYNLHPARFSLNDYLTYWSKNTKHLTDAMEEGDFISTSC